MKYLIILIILLIAACGQETKTIKSDPEIVTETIIETVTELVEVITPPPPPQIVTVTEYINAPILPPETITVIEYVNSPIPDPPPPPTIKTLVIYNGTGYGTSEGEYYYHGDKGHITYIGNGNIVVDDLLYELDQYGEILTSYRIPCIPDAVTISGQDVWSFEVIPPESAGDMGALYRTYTRVWKNNNEHGDWYLNEWEVTGAVTTESGEVVASSTVGALYPQTTSVAVAYAGQDGLLIHSNNIVATSSIIRTDQDYQVNFTTNYFLSANQWQKSGGIWYSWNGYTWSETYGLTEQANVLTAFIVSGANPPYVIAAGERLEHNETVLYWIECNTGWLYRFTPSLDRLEQIMRLYNGSGDRIDGTNAAKVINPVMTDTALYFEYETVIYKYEFTSGLINSFAAGVTVWGM